MRIAIGALIVFAIGIGAGVVLQRQLDDDQRARPRVVEGYVFVNASGTGMSFREDFDAEVEDGFNIGGPPWRGGSATWHDTGPSCLEPLVENQRVRLGLVTVEPTEDAPGYKAVVWIQCLD